MCLCLVCSGDSVHVHVSVHVQIYVCSVANLKFVSLACMPNEPKSATVKKVSVCIHLSVCISSSVCVWCQI